MGGEKPPTSQCFPKNRWDVMGGVSGVSLGGSGVSIGGVMILRFEKNPLRQVQLT